MQHVLLTFLPEGSQDSGVGTAVCRDSSKTRPLALADTSCKALSAAMGLPLASVAKSTVHAMQSGGVGGRSITSNVVEAEDWGLSQWLRDRPHSALLLTDFAAAFPSLFVSWILTVLST
eukprot:8230774-Pyramimonas_sp.AAC.1